MFAKKCFVSAILVIVAFLAGVPCEAVADQDDPQDRIVKVCPPEDVDCDGKSNDFDDCPDVPGAKSACGCPDVDGDMFPEDVGQCPKGVCPESKCSGNIGQAGGTYRLLVDLCPPPAQMSAVEFGGLGKGQDEFKESGNGILDLDGCPGKVLDEDGDGFLQPMDPCPELVGFNGGCPGSSDDPDNDGVVGSEDRCPQVPILSGETDEFLQKGCPSDEYQAIYGFRVSQYFARNDLVKEQKLRIEVARASVAKPGIEVVWGGSATPEKSRIAKPGDRDRDSIPDTEDRCPDEKEDYVGDDLLNPDGCPAKTVAQAPAKPEPVLVDGEVEIKDGETYTWVPPPAFKEKGMLEATPTPEPSKDTDGDGISDDLDKCPAEPEDYDGFEDKDGCPDELDPNSDTDGDGVDAINDRCPDVPGEPNYGGCPRPVSAPEPTTTPKAPVVVEEVVEPDPEFEYVEPEPAPEPEPEPAKPASPPLAESPSRPEPFVAPSEEPADDRDEYGGVQPWSMGPCPTQDQPVNYIWTGAVGAIPPVGTEGCPAGLIPGVMGTADPIRGGRRGQDDLDGRRATRVAPPDWDGGWCSLGITTIIGNSVAAACVVPTPTSVGLPGVSDADLNGKISDEVGRQLAGLPLPPDLTEEVGDIGDRVSVLEDAPKSLVDLSGYSEVGVLGLPGVLAASLGVGLKLLDDWFVAEVGVAYTRARGTHIHNYGVEVGVKPFGVRILPWLDVLVVIRGGQYAWAPFTLWQIRRWGAGIAVSVRPFGDLIEIAAEFLGGESWRSKSQHPFVPNAEFRGQIGVRLILGAEPQ